MFLKPKSHGSGIMVSDFIDEHNGYLRLKSEEFVHPLSLQTDCKRADTPSSVDEILDTAVFNKRPGSLFLVPTSKTLGTGSNARNVFLIKLSTMLSFTSSLNNDSLACALQFILVQKFIPQWWQCIARSLVQHIVSKTFLLI